MALKNLHQYPESIRRARRVVDLASAEGDRPALANALSILADALRYSGDLEGALQNILAARKAIEGYTFPSERLRYNSLHNIMWRHGLILGADSHISLMRPDEAVVVLQQAFDIIEAEARKDQNDASVRILFVQAGRELGNILRHKKPARALEIFDHAIARITEVKNNARATRGKAQLLAASSYPLRRLNRADEAMRRIDSAFELLKETKSYPTNTINTDDESSLVMRALGDHLADVGQTGRALETYREYLQKWMASKPDPENDLRHASTLSYIYAALSRLYVVNGELENAKAVSAMRLKIWQDWSRKLPGSPFIQRELAAASS